MAEPKRNGVLKLDDARERTPTVNPVEAMRKQLAVAVYGAVKESDVEEMVGKLKELALAGDHKAMKMYFELIGVMGKQQPPPPAAGDNAGLKLMAESLRDLVDEIRIGKAHAARDTKLLGNGESEDDDE
jgi:hypothetical protein